MKHMIPIIICVSFILLGIIFLRTQTTQYYNPLSQSHSPIPSLYPFREMTIPTCANVHIRVLLVLRTFRMRQILIPHISQVMIRMG